MAISLDAIQDAEFPVHWDDPSDAERTYVTDMMHNPHPMSPLAQSLQPTTFNAMVTAMQEFGLPFKTMHIRFHNYYQFERLEMIEPANPDEAAAGEAAIEATMQREVGRLADRWQNEFFPRIRQIIDRFIDIERSIAASATADARAMLSEFVNLRFELWTIHFRVVVPMMLSMQIYDEFYQDLFGGTDAEGHALLVGRPTMSVAAAIGLSDLAAAARSAGLDRLIQDTAVESLQDELRQSEPGRAFLDQLGAYLDEFGYRSDLFDIMTPTWRETREIPLASVRSYLISSFDARAEHEATAQSADAALEIARGRLASYPEPVRNQFEALVRGARFAAFLQEEHNFYIDQMGLAWARLLFLQVGNRLVEDGVLEDADDIVMLRIEEIQDLIGKPVDDYLRDETRALVATRRADMAFARTLTPPPFLGPPPEGPHGDNVMNRALARFWGGPPQAAESPDQLKGNAGARGIATGEAFVAHSLAEATAIKPGQILVATTTMPAWTPFFGIAAAVVTETGGPLSHCAIVAREYGIPAVVGVAGAMRAIQPGQRITVDGDKGIVRLTPDPLPA